MSKQKMWYAVLAVLMVASFVLGACTAAPTPAPTSEPAMTEAAAQPTAAPATEAGTEATEPPAAAGGDVFADVDPSGETVTFWHQQTKAKKDALDKIVADFNANNEWGITVEAEYQGSYNDIFNKMLGVLNTEDAPNLVVAYQNQAATYQLGDGLADMTPLVDSAKWGLSEEEQKDFFEGFFMQDIFPTYGNARLGFPPNRSAEVMFYNADWLKELGYDAPPATPEEFKEMACKAAETPFSNATVDGSIGYELDVDASRFASWAFAFGGDIYNYNTNQYTYDSDAAVKAMTFLQDLFNSGCATLPAEKYGDQTDFGQGKVLFTVGSSSGLTFYKSAVEEGAKFNWSVAALPHTTPDPAINIYGASVSMPKSTPEKELASWLFLKYYTSPEVQADWAQASEYFPVRASVADSMKEYFDSNPAYKTAFDLLQYGKFEPPVPGYDFVREKVSEAMAAISSGEDVAATLKSLNEESNVMLAEQEASPLPTPVPTKPPEPTAAATEAVTTTTSTTDIGTAAHPIKVLFVPSVDANVITSGGDVMAKALKEATGLEFKVSVPTSYAATIEEMCASPTDTMGFIPGLGYVLANQLCGVDVAFKAVRFGADVYWAQIIVQRDSDIKTLADLNGKKWGYGDAGSTSGYMVPLVMFNEQGIKPGQTVETGGHAQSVKAVYNGEVDFATTFFTPPLPPKGTDAWKEGQEPDVPADVIEECAPSADGKTLMCGDWRILDARANIREEAPDVIQKVRILAVSPAIPNDTLSFGPEFPADLRAKIEAALVEFAKTESWNNSIGSQDFYGWTGINPATDEEYDFVRKMVEAVGYSMEDLGQ